jgi:hypothetical protein
VAKKKEVESKEAVVGEEVIAEEVVTEGGLKRIKVTAAQLKTLQEEEKLVGYDPEKGEALIR